MNLAGKKLNVGCGRDIRPEYVNLDAVSLPGVDVVHDVETLPLPFGDSEFDAILCRDVLEHVDYVPLVKELHRILEKGGRLEIRVPHFTSANNYADPTHRKFFSVRTFDFFVHGAKLRQDHIFDYEFERIESARISFEKGILLFNYLVEPLLNVSVKFLRLYESTWVSRLFPAENVHVVLVK